MLDLVRMEYLFNRRYFLTILVILVVHSVWMAFLLPSPLVFVFAAAMIVGFSMPIGPCREDKFKTSSLVCSLPVRRPDIVFAKYALTWLTSLAGFLVIALLIAVYPFSKIGGGQILTLRAFFVFAAFLSLIIAVILPYTIRFGITGLMIMLVSFQFLGVIMLLFAQILGRERNLLRTAIEAFIKALRFVVYHEATPGYFLLLAIIILVLNTGSLILSRIFYLRREL